MTSRKSLKFKSSNQSIDGIQMMELGNLCPQFKDYCLVAEHRKITLVDKNFCEICKKKPNLTDAFFLKFFQHLPGSWRTNHYMFFKSFGHLFRPISQDICVVPYINVNETSITVIYYKISHLNVATMKKLYELDMGVTFNGLSGQLSIKVPYDKGLDSLSTITSFTDVSHIQSTIYNEPASCVTDIASVSGRKRKRFEDE